MISKPTDKFQGEIMEMKLRDLIELKELSEPIFDIKNRKRGKIIGFTGPMFSGKTTELIRMYERYIIGKKKSLMVKPSLDKRYGLDYVATHMGYKVNSYALEDSSQLYDLIQKYKKDPIDVKYNHHATTLYGPLKGIFIDEIQFFDSGIIDVIEDVTYNYGIDIYWSGLNRDSRGKPFMFRDEKEHIGYLMAISDNIYVLDAVCTLCGENATMTYRKVDSDNLIEIGGADKYEARCKDHWVPR